MASIRSYEAYKKQYQITVKRNVMRTEMYTKEEYDFAYENVKGAGFHDPARAIALGQRDVSSPQQKVYSRAARGAWEYASESGELDIFKDTLGISNRKEFNQKFIQQHAKEIFDFLRDTIGYDEQDIDEILSPKETTESSGTLAAG